MDQDTRWDCTDLELAFLFVIILFLVSSGVEGGGEERENRRGEQGAVETWGKMAEPEQCFYFLCLLSMGSILVTPKQL